MGVFLKSSIRSLDWLSQTRHHTVTVRKADLCKSIIPLKSIGIKFLAYNQPKRYLTSL